MFMDHHGPVSAQPLDPRQLQEDWDREGLTAHMRLLRREAAIRSLAPRLDRLTARFAYVVMGLTGLLFAFHAVRFALRVWGHA